MKIKKALVLVLFLLLLALTVTSQIPKSITSATSVEEKQDCTTTFYNQTEDVYRYVIRERNVYGNCVYYKNYTRCLNSSGLNTDCSLKQTSYNFSCTIEKESYQSYEVIGNKITLKNATSCSPKSYVISSVQGTTTQIKEIDFSSWGVCVNSTENGCLAITCGTLKGGSARNGIFNGCDGGKSCQKFLFCQDGIKVLYKASRDDFVGEDPTYHLSKLTYSEVGK